MSKAKIIGEESLSGNQKIISDYLENYDSKSSKMTIKTALVMFAEHFNKSFYDIEIRDIKQFHLYLLKSIHLTLVSKKLYLGFVKKFIEGFLQDNIKSFDPANLMLFFFFLKDSRNFNWRGVHKESERDNNVTFEKEELIKILRYLKRRDNPKYLIFRILTETGMRRGEVVSIDLETVFKGKVIKIEDDLEKRLLRVKGKTGKKAYYTTRDLANKLRKFIESRRKLKLSTNALFVSNRGNRLCADVLNKTLSGYDYKQRNKRFPGLLEKLGIDKKAHPHSFRLTLNDFREQMDCPPKYLNILLNHRQKGVNYEHYVSDKTKMQKFLEFYDKFYPYKNLIF